MAEYEINIPVKYYKKLEIEAKKEGITVEQLANRIIQEQVPKLIRKLKREKRGGK